MIFKETCVSVADKSGPSRVRTIHTYHKKKYKFARAGTYIKCAVEAIMRFPPRIRGKRFRPIRPGFILRGFMTCVRAMRSIKGVMKQSVFTNSVVFVKKKGFIKSKYVLGPVCRPRYSRRFRAKFNKLL